MISAAKTHVVSRRKTLSQYLSGPQLHGRDRNSAAEKADFHAQARLFCFALARELGVRREAYEVRVNLADEISAGECTLHTGQFFLQITHAGDRGADFDENRSVRARRCASMTTFGSDANTSHWMPIAMLENVEQARSWIVDFLYRTRGEA